MFIGRKEELAKLSAMHKSGKFEFAVVYGRRRVGKTTLIREFCRGKRAFYFVARETSSDANLRMLSEEMAAQGFVRHGTYFESWDAFLATAGELASTERFVVAIDEYPYLASAERSISSALQMYIDGVFRSGHLFLILCGSSMSFMENQILGHKSPLYGRRTAQFHVKPFGFFTAREFMPTFTQEEQAALYGATGGVPEYLAQIDGSASLKENITELFLKATGPLYEEPSNLLKQELREPALYNAIIAAVAGGSTRLNEIATKVGMESNKTAKYLASLISLGIIGKETPIGEKVGRKTIYVVADGMFRFWYRFVFPNMSAIVSGAGGVVYDKKVAEGMPQFLGGVFEGICVEYLLAMQTRGKLPIFAGAIGRWWGNNPAFKRQDEIDILAIDGGAALIGECKWRAGEVDADVLAALVERGEIFAKARNFYYIFARKGFTKKMAAAQKERGDVTLLSLADMTREYDGAARPI
ncbi:MAG: ATP-binding protein [Synergistaceae bacterium]|nr:ATP-binding protein [Synergistaceae bacterium]